MSYNGKLTKAKLVKNDEFYTKMEDVKRVCDRFIPYFKNKIIYCNCDNPNISQFVKYFLDNFNAFGLKAVYTSDIQTKTARFYSSPETYVEEKLKTGEFGSEEALDILSKSDIVVTNPPFSIFRDFFDVLYNSGKKFLVISHLLSISYNNVFPHFVNREFSVAESDHGMEFDTPTLKETKKKLNNCIWITNLPNDYGKVLPQNPDVVFSKDKYETFDNDPEVININRMKQIPYKYEGVMAVPITIIEYYNKGGFELLGKLNKPVINGKDIYSRFLIKLLS